MTEPFDSRVPKNDPWRQLGITFVCSLVLGITCCGGGLSLGSSRSNLLSTLGTLLAIVGTISILVSLGTIITAIVKLLLALFTGLRR